MQPGKVTINVTFASDEANGVGGRSTVRTSGLDGLMQAFKTCTDAIIANLALIQRDDGKLLDETVLLHTLSSEVRALLSSTAWNIRGSWLTATAYAKGDVVLQNSIVYLCISAHTSGVFAADLAASNWGQVTANATASTTSFSPTSKISALNVQGAIQELDDEVRPSVSILNRQLYNGL